MDNEKMLLSLYKKHEYELTQHKTQQMVFLIAVTTVLISIVAVAMLHKSSILLYGLFGSLGLMIVCYILQFFKVITLNTATLIYFSYFYFVFLPLFWYYTNGVADTAPYISFLFPLVIFLVFTRKASIRIQIGLMITVIAMSAYSVAVAPPDAVGDVTFKVIVYTIMMFLMNFYLLYLSSRYEKMHDQFLSGSIKDELTQAFNRNVLDVILDHLEAQYQADGKDYVMIMADVDRFKELNDTYGHVAGDIVLRNTATCIKTNMREDDFVIRYGGDEFLVILMDTTLERATAVFNRVSETKDCQQLLDFKINISHGFAKRSECQTAREAMILADQRMYEQKSYKR